MEEENPQKPAQHFTEDAFLKLPEPELLEGKDAIAQAHQQMIEQGITVLPERMLQ